MRGPIVFGLLAFTIATVGYSLPGYGASDGALREQVSTIFTQRCAVCHDPAGVRKYAEAKGKFDHVLDLDRLATSAKLVNPDEVFQPLITADRLAQTQNNDLKDIAARLKQANLPRNQFLAAFADIRKAAVTQVAQISTPVAFNVAQPIRRPAAIEAYQAGDFETAYALWYGAAEGGNADAQYNIGVLHARGEGVRKDNEKAISWYRRAAASGSANAQYLMGELYNAGRAVPQDFTAALGWFERAAAQGHVTARAQADLLTLTSGPSASTTRRLASLQSGAGLRTLPPPAAPIFSTIFPAEGWRIQLASLPDADLVPIMWQRLRERYNDLLGGLGVHIKQSARARGPTFEIQVGPVADRQIAQALCLRLQSEDQECRVVNP